MLHRRNGIRFSAWIFIVFASFGATISLLGMDPAPSSVNATGNQIIRRLVEANEKRSHDLLHYTEKRHYAVKYSGFPHAIAASMDVEVTYNAPSSKSFQVLSKTGPKVLIDHVLKRLLESEEQAAKDPSKTALTPENYNFTLIRTEDTASQNLYVFHVEPRVDRKFLYRGTIWVDAKDYAVVKIEAEPAQNPSFWIKSTMIHHVYSKTGDFWLPLRNRSETQVRLGGTAVLTIDYGAYHIPAAHS